MIGWLSIQVYMYPIFLYTLPVLVIYHDPYI